MRNGSMVVFPKLYIYIILFGDNVHEKLVSAVNEFRFVMYKHGMCESVF